MKDQLRTHTRRKSGFDRRAFLKGSGAAAAATALATGGGIAEAGAGGTEVVSGEKDIALSVNDRKYSIKVEPRTTLCDALRYRCGLTGVKPVDPDGVSGAATVIINGKPASAMTTLALACDGKEIRTVESLGGANPDEVVQAFVNNDAQQCGFCTPGFVVAVRAFLDKNPSASEAQIREGLNGNICRCGTYSHVINAAIEVAKGGS